MLGISPSEIDELSIYEMSIYTKLIPLWINDENERQVKIIQKAISEMF